MLRWRSETRGHDADHRIGVSAQLNRVAHRAWIAAQVVLPEMVADHREARSAWHIFPGRNELAQARLHAERFEKPRIDEPDMDLHRFGCAYVVHLLDVDSTALRECARLSQDIHHVRERIVLLDDDEILWILVGKWTEQHSVDHAEYRRVCADAESEGEGGNSCETRGLAQPAKAQLNVLKELLQPDQGPHLACLFLDARHVAELAQGRTARFLGRHPASDVVLSLLLDVVANVLVEILEHALAAIHDLLFWSAACLAGRRIRAIAPASLSHLLVSATSCRLPFAVRR